MSTVSPAKATPPNPNRDTKSALPFWFLAMPVCSERTRQSHSKLPRWSMRPKPVRISKILALECSADNTTAAYLTGDPKSFAYQTARVRWPVIIVCLPKICHGVDGCEIDVKSAADPSN